MPCAISREVACKSFRKATGEALERISGRSLREYPGLVRGISVEHPKEFLVELLEKLPLQL